MPKVAAPKKTKTSTEGTRKKPSAYNLFMKSELPKYKEKHSGVSHTEAFKIVAGMWKDSPDNPKNKK